MVQRIGLVLALVLALAAPALATAPTIVQTAPFVADGGTNVETSTLGTNVTAGNLIVVLSSRDSAISSSLSQCTYNGSNMTVDYNSGFVQGTAPNGVILILAHATGVASVNVVACTYGSNGQMSQILAEVNGGSVITTQSGTCATTGCVATVDHNLLSAGSRALGMATTNGGAVAPSCGAGWAAVVIIGCQGTTNATATFASTTVAGHASAVAYFDLGTPPTATSLPGWIGAYEPVPERIFPLVLSLVGR